MVTTDDSLEEQEDIPCAKLVRAQDVSDPEIKAWDYSNLKQDDEKVAQKIHADVVEKIRREAEPELLRQTTLLKKETFEKAHQEGYDAGFEKGLLQGREQAIEQSEQKAKQALEPLVKRLDSLLSVMQSPFHEVEKEVLESFANLSLEIAKSFIKQEISKDNNWTLKAVQEAINMLPEESVLLNIELNPEDILLIDQYRQEHSKDWQLKPNSTIPVGSCRVKQNFSIVENIWQEQLIDYLLKVSEQITAKTSDINQSIQNSVSQSSENSVKNLKSSPDDTDSNLLRESP